jgi:hypothetical protein
VAFHPEDKQEIGVKYSVGGKRWKGWELRRIYEIDHSVMGTAGRLTGRAEAFFSLRSDFCLSGNGECALGMPGRSAMRDGRDPLADLRCISSSSC